MKRAYTGYIKGFLIEVVDIQAHSPGEAKALIYYAAKEAGFRRRDGLKFTDVRVRLKR